MLALKVYANAIGLFFGIAMLAGCASTKVTEQTLMVTPGLARPNQIWVYGIVAQSPDMPADSSLAGQVGSPSTPPTSEEIETGRKYGAMIAQELVKDIQAMGMPAIQAGPGSSPVGG
jgi:phage tail protein X